MSTAGTDSLFKRFRDMVPVGCVPLSGVRLVRFLEPSGDEGIRIISHWPDSAEALRFKVNGDEAVAAAVGTLLLASLGYAQPDEGAA